MPALFRFFFRLPRYFYVQIKNRATFMTNVTKMLKFRQRLNYCFDKQALIVASAALACSILHTLFNFYYLKVFLNFYHLDAFWLNLAQILFMIWNALNDPIFGYIQVIFFSLTIELIELDLMFHLTFLRTNLALIFIIKLKFYSFRHLFQLYQK